MITKNIEKNLIEIFVYGSQTVCLTFDFDERLKTKKESTSNMSLGCVMK